MNRKLAATRRRRVLLRSLRRRSPAQPTQRPVCRSFKLGGRTLHVGDARQQLDVHVRQAVGRQADRRPRSDLASRIVPLTNGPRGLHCWRTPTSRRGHATGGHVLQRDVRISRAPASRGSRSSDEDADRYNGHRNHRGGRCIAASARRRRRRLRLGRSEQCGRVSTADLGPAAARPSGSASRRCCATIRRAPRARRTSGPVRLGRVERRHADQHDRDVRARAEPATQPRSQSRRGRRERATTRAGSEGLPRADARAYELRR